MKRLLLGQKVKMREENFGILIFNPETFSVISINESGRKLLNSCDGSRSFDEILSSIEPRNKDVLDNVNLFLRSLISAGVIKEVNGDE